MANAYESAGSGMGRARPLVWAAAGALLLAPLVAMRFTAEVNWTPSDFAVFGAMLAVTLGGYEFLARKAGSVAYRAGAGVAMLAAFLLIWVNLAVGFLGDEGNPANLMFASVLAAAMGGAIAARFRAAGMARAMLATALAQGLAGGIGLAAGFASPGAAGVYEVTIGTGLFGALWLVAAWLFHKAG